MNKKLSVVKQLYDEQQAVFVANIGPLVEPCTKEQYLAKAKRVPQVRLPLTSILFHTLVEPLGKTRRHTLYTCFWA